MTQAFFVSTRVRWVVHCGEELGCVGNEAGSGGTLPGTVDLVAGQSHRPLRPGGYLRQPSISIS